MTTRIAIAGRWRRLFRPGELAAGHSGSYAWGLVPQARRRAPDLSIAASARVLWQRIAASLSLLTSVRVKLLEAPGKGAGLRNAGRWRRLVCGFASALLAQRSPRGRDRRGEFQSINGGFGVVMPFGPLRGSVDASIGVSGLTSGDVTLYCYCEVQPCVSG